MKNFFIDKLKKAYLEKGFAPYDIDLSYCEHLTAVEIIEEIRRVKSTTRLEIEIYRILNQNKLTSDDDFSDYFEDVEDLAEVEICLSFCEHNCNNGGGKCSYFKERLEEIFKEVAKNCEIEIENKLRLIFDNDKNNTILESYNLFRSHYNIALVETLHNKENQKIYADLDNLIFYNKYELFYELILQDKEFIRHLWKEGGGNL